MSSNAYLQLGLTLGLLLVAVRPLGGYIARVYTGRDPVMERVVGPFERWLYRRAGVDPMCEMTWVQYSKSVLLFSLLGIGCVYIVQRLQLYLPLNPEGHAAVSPDSSFNTAVSFVTNTNWQGYAGEATMAYLTQMLALTVQNFLSAATGMAMLVALMRGFVRQKSTTLGNFWVDLVRGTLYILLPLCVGFALVLASEGVVQTFGPTREVPLLEPTVDGDGNPVTTQKIALGPVASQVAIKQLGTNGGGFFNVNSAHPLENPTPFTNLLQTLAILLVRAHCVIPSALWSVIGVKDGHCWRRCWLSSCPCWVLP